MMVRVKFGASNVPTGKMFIFVSGFSIDSRESALVGFDEGAPLWLFSPSSSLEGKPVQSAGWDCSFPGGYFFAKEQVTISFPSSNIVMSNHCFLSTLGKIENFYAPVWKKRCARRRRIFKPHQSPGSIFPEQTSGPWNSC